LEETAGSIFEVVHLKMKAASFFETSAPIYQWTWYYVLIYSTLPSEIKNVKSIRKFKTLLSNFLLERNFYSVEEFVTVDF
jgi:hypothetical protein